MNAQRESRFSVARSGSHGSVGYQSAAVARRRYYAQPEL